MAVDTGTINGLFEQNELDLRLPGEVESSVLSVFYIFF